MKPWFWAIWLVSKGIHAFCKLIESDASPSNSSQTAVDIEQYFLSSGLYLPKQLYDEKEIIPDKPGIYGWYFCHLFDKLFDDESKANFVKNAIKIEIHDETDDNISLKYLLMYIGIAEGQTLRERIYDKHLNGSFKDSTLRESLTALLYGDNDLDPKKKLKGEIERDKLNSWICENAIISWIAHDNPKSVETEFIKQYGKVLPLNIQGNKDNPWRAKLRLLRKQRRNI